MLLKPGQMACTEDGLIYFRWPKGKLPGRARIFALPKSSVSCVSIACSHIIVRNITVMHAGNDGFNVHGQWLGIRLENVRAALQRGRRHCAHEEVQMDVDGAEIAWNGSHPLAAWPTSARARPLTRTAACMTTWVPRFKFAGRSHTVTDTLIYNQVKDFDVAEGTRFHQERNIERR